MSEDKALNKSVDELSTQELVEMKNALSSMLKSYGWKIFTELNRVQRVRREEILDQPLDGETATYKQEFMKGERVAFKIDLGLPEAHLGAVNYELKARSTGDEDDGEESED